MGLPKLHQAVRLNMIRDTADQMSSNRAQLWELICNVDGLLGMIMNLRPATRRYQSTDAGILVVNGVVQPQTYLSKLIDIAARIHDLDGSAQNQNHGAKLHLELAAELGTLASQTPSSWWARDQNDCAKPDDIVQFLHCCIVMRVHLPLALRQAAGPEQMYSQLACIDVCHSVAQRYEFLNRSFPPGFFAFRLIDLHAFIAAVVLLLSSHMSSSERHSFRMDEGRLRDVAMEIIRLMDERSEAKVGSDFARQGSSVLYDLHTFLQQDDSNARAQDLTVKVPLLGKVHIRRNFRPSSGTRGSNMPPPSNANAYTGIHNEQPIFTLHDKTPYSMESPTKDNAFSPGQWQWNNFSWSIDDSYNSFFEDALMAESFGQSMSWQDALNCSMATG